MIRRIQLEARRPAFEPEATAKLAQLPGLAVSLFLTASVTLTSSPTR